MKNRSKRYLNNKYYVMSLIASLPSTTVMFIVELNFLKMSLYEPAERPFEVILLSTRSNLFVSTEIRASVRSLNSSILSILSN